MEEIKIGDRVIMGTALGTILETEPTYFKIKFDEHTINDVREFCYPNTLINFLIPEEIPKDEEKE